MTAVDTDLGQPLVDADLAAVRQELVETQEALVASRLEARQLRAQVDAVRADVADITSRLEKGRRRRRKP